MHPNVEHRVGAALGRFRPIHGDVGIADDVLGGVLIAGITAIAGDADARCHHDVVAGHMLAMEKGKSGERYILGGENVTYEQLFTIVGEITGLRGPGTPVTSGVAELTGRLMELRARFTGQEPEITFRMARDFVDKYSWVTSAKAEAALGYTHRPARRTLARSVQWYLQNGYVEPRVARRIRVDLRAPALATRQ